jgi:hypothetical protein
MKRNGVKDGEVLTSINFVNELASIFESQKRSLEQLNYVEQVFDIQSFMRVIKAHQGVIEDCVIAVIDAYLNFKNVTNLVQSLLFASRKLKMCFRLLV